MLENINELSVLVSAFFAVAFGNIWYSTVLFGNTWSKFVKGNNKKLIRLTIKSVLVYIVIFFLIAKFITLDVEITSVSQGTLISMLIIFLLAHILFLVIWKEKHFSYFLIHGGYVASVLLGGSVIISSWPW